LWTEDNRYFTCSSIESRLIATDGWSHYTGGFPRGVCISPAARIVGLSALVERGSRDFTSGAIAVYDAAWKPRHYVHLVREGMVLDMLAIAPHEGSAIEAAHDADVAYPVVTRMTDRELLA